jgi:tetratricopeptide (TPR) repeat protein
MWDDHPVASAMGLTAWGLNRLGYGWGYYPYTNPYYADYPVESSVVYDYSEPLIVYESAPPQTVVVEAPATQAPVVVESPGTSAAPEAPQTPAPPSLPPGVSQSALDTFDQARNAFYQNDYTKALELTNESLKSMPKDAAIHEFRALILFAMGNYPEAASVIYSVLAVGPGWDWTTMVSMYPDVDTYTAQLRQLEGFVKTNASSSAAHFLLAYHYITMKHNSTAEGELKKVVELTPDNNVAVELLTMIAGPDAIPKPPATPEQLAVQNAPAPKEAELVGNWSATARNAKFEMNLADDGKFTWVHEQDGKRQEVKGVYALQDKSLAMEPDSGGIMLADVTNLGNNTLHFQMVGAPPGDSGLQFKK